MKLLSHQQLKHETDRRLERLFAQRVKQAAAIDERYAELLTEMGAFMARGGKRLRPYLTYLTYIGYGGNNTAAILDVAASQELFHNFLLIHDDIIDRDTTRYGGDNLTGRYLQKLSQLQSLADRRHYADAVALLAGDTNAALALEQIVNSDFDDKVKLRAVKRMNQMIFEIVGGELVDVLLPLEPKLMMTEPRLRQIIRYKTTSYSFEAPMQLGAILAERDQDELKAISGFAEPLGLAFQLVDDLLGMFGDESVTGKPATTDLKEGKRTLLMSYGLELARDDDLEFLQTQLGNPAAGEPEHRRVCAILEQCGARAKVMQLADEQAKVAGKRLGDLGMSSEVHRALGAVIKLCVSRSS